MKNMFMENMPMEDTLMENMLMKKSVDAGMLIIIRRKNAAMITVMITVKITKNPAADITMGITTTMGIITMQTRYSQAGAKRLLTSTRMKNWISF